MRRSRSRGRHTFCSRDAVLVFRDGKRSFDVEARLRALEDAARSHDALDVLLRAGELESALEDAGDPAAAELAR